MQEKEYALLALLDEPMLLAEGGRIVCLNPALERLLGEDWRGRALEELLGCEMEEDGFALTLELSGRSYTVLSRGASDRRLLRFLPVRDENAENGAFLVSMSSSLSTVRAATEELALTAEALGLRELDENLSRLRRAGYQLTRLLKNNELLLADSAEDAVFCPELLELGGFLGNIVDTLERLLPRLRIDYSFCSPLQLPADPALLETALFELVRLCCLESEGAVPLSLSLSATQSHGLIRLTAPGLALGEERLAELLSLSDAPTDYSELGRGAGRGLQVVRTVAKLHGGSLLSYAPAAGTVFQLSLSRFTKSGGSLHGKSEPVHSMDRLLTSLSDVLPDDCFTNEFQD